MKKIVRRFSRQFTYGQKGFTLIELLVVIAILGVLAVIVIPQVSKFIGSGNLAAANTEAHDVLTAVVAYMADNNLTAVPVAPGNVVGPTADMAAGPAGTTPGSFLANQASMQADYDFNPDGTFISGTQIAGSKWTGIQWDNATNSWIKTP